MRLLKLCPISQCPNNCVPCGRQRMKGWAKWRRTPIVLLLRNCLPSVFRFQWILCVRAWFWGSPLVFRGTGPSRAEPYHGPEPGDGQRPGEEEQRGCHRLSFHSERRNESRHSLERHDVYRPIKSPLKLLLGWQHIYLIWFFCILQIQGDK